MPRLQVTNTACHAPAEGIYRHDPAQTHTGKPVFVKEPVATGQLRWCANRLKHARRDGKRSSS